MITLTIITDAGETVRTFQQDTVQIGSPDQSDVHVSLPDGTPSGVLFEITCHEGSYTVGNLGVDGVLLLNEQPVEREFLNNGDLLCCPGVQVKFSAETDEELLVEATEDDDTLDTLLIDNDFLSDIPPTPESSANAAEETGSQTEQVDSSIFEEYATLEADDDYFEAEQKTNTAVDEVITETNESPLEAVQDDEAPPPYEEDLPSEPEHEAEGEDIADLDIDKELAELNDLFGEDDLNDLDDYDVSVELSDDDIDALVEEAEKLETENLSEAETEEPAAENQVDLGFDEGIDEDLADELAFNLDTSADSTQEAEQSPPASDSLMTDDELREEEDAADQELVLDFATEEVDNELSEVIQTQQTEGPSQASVVDTTQTETSQDEWTAIEQDIIEDDKESDLAAVHHAPEKRQGLSARSLVLVAVALIMGMIGGAWTLTKSYLSEQNAVAELVAARQLSDAAMATLAAQMYQGLSIEDLQTNPELILDRLDAVLSTDYRGPRRSLSLLLGLNYDLKLIGSQESSRFILFAVPKQNWVHWLVPRAGFVVDSENFYLRRESNTELWQTIFANHKWIEDCEREALSSYTHSGVPTVLALLEGSGRNSGYAVPKDLTYVLNDADSLIYYAPRYFAFTEDLVHQLASYSTPLLTEHQRTLLRGTLERLRRLDRPVLYSTGSSEEAAQASQNLADHFPNHQFVVGLLSLDNSDGFVRRADILMTDEAYASIGSDEMIDVEDAIEEAIDTSHPLYVALSEVALQRTEALQKISAEITALLNHHNHKETVAFYAEHQNLLDKYQKTSKQYREKITRILDSLYTDYVADNPDQNLPIYLSSIRAHDLEELLPESIQKAQQTSGLTPANEEEQQQIPLAFEAIQESASFHSLHDATQTAVRLLENHGVDVASPTDATANELRTVTLQAVSTLLLTPDTPLQKDSLDSASRLLLSQTLNLAHIPEDEEREFYLTEFDHLVEKYRNISHKEIEQHQELEFQLTELLEAGDKLMPQYREDLEGKLSQTEQKLGESRQELADLKAKMKQVPLETMTASPAEQQKNYGRLGQQLLVHESRKAPSLEREHKLEEAILLLEQSTEHNRGLWQDILEARRLLTERPKEVIEAVVQSNLGFSKTRNPLPSSIRKDFKRYIRSKKSLARIRNQEQFEVQFALFKEANRSLLEGIVDNCATVEGESAALMTAFDAYIQRLGDFKNSYEQAQKEGFFVADQRYHSGMLDKLKIHLGHVQDFRKRLESATSQLSEASYRHRELAMEELESFNGTSKVTAATVGALADRHNSIIYPNVLAENFKSKLANLLNLNVHPIPQ